MCEGQGQRARALERRVKGWVPAATRAVRSSEPGACHLPDSLPELPSQMKRDAGGFQNACLVLMAHVSKTFLCLQDQNLCNKVGRIVNEVRAPGF